MGEGNGTPLQYSCLENPRDRGASWAAVYGVTQCWHDWSDLAAAAATCLYCYFLIFHYFGIIYWLSVGFPGGSLGKESACSAGDARDTGSNLGSGRSPRGEQGNPIQYSCLEDPTDRGTWRVVVHRVAKSWTQLKRLRTHASTDSLQWKAKILLCFPLLSSLSPPTQLSSS